MLAFLRGRKTYLTGAGTLLYAVWVYAVEEDHARAVNLAIAGLSLIFLRAGVSKTGRRR